MRSSFEWGGVQDAPSPSHGGIIPALRDRVGIASAGGTRPFARPKGMGWQGSAGGHPNMKARVVSNDTGQGATRSLEGSRRVSVAGS
jgi:hypothetical protein